MQARVNPRHSVEVPEEHVGTVTSLLKVLESRVWVAGFIADILDHSEIFGSGACTPDWIAEQVAGPALFLDSKEP
jgi:hypothetical protein